MCYVRRECVFSTVLARPAKADRLLLKPTDLPLSAGETITLQITFAWSMNPSHTGRQSNRQRVSILSDLSPI